MRRSRSADRGCRGDSGESLALLVVWPALITAILLMLVHAFIVTNARAEAQVAASEGLRSAWRAIADLDFSQDPGAPGNPYTLPAPHPDLRDMVEAVEAAVAQSAATKEGWRWWTPGAPAVQSDWCHDYTVPPLSNATPAQTPPQVGATPPPTGAPGSYRPSVGMFGPGESGWLRVVVSGEVIGPLAALWPNRLDKVYAVAQGPAVLIASDEIDPGLVVPVELPTC